MSEIYDILSRIFLMVSEYEEEIEQIRIQLNSENNFDLVQLFSNLSTNHSITSHNLLEFYLQYSDDSEINIEELELYLTKIIFFYDEDRNGELSYSEFISFVLSQTKYNLRRKIHINNNDDYKYELSNNIIILFNGLVEKEIELIQNLEIFENQLYQIKGFNPSLIFEKIENKGYITPGSIIMILDEQDIKISNNSIQNIMRRFDVNGDCRIELEDFITIMNFAQIKKLNYGKEMLVREKNTNYNINNYNKVNLSNENKKNFSKSQNYNNDNYIKINNQKFHNLSKLNERRIENKLEKEKSLSPNIYYKCNSLSHRNNQNFYNSLKSEKRDRTPIRKNIINEYINDNDFRRSKRTNLSHNIIDRINKKDDDFFDELNATPNHKSSSRFFNDNSNYKSFMKDEFEKVKKNTINKLYDELNDNKMSKNKINKNLNFSYNSDSPNNSNLNNSNSNILFYSSNQNTNNNNNIEISNNIKNINNLTLETYQKVKKEYLDIHNNINIFNYNKQEKERNNQENNIIINRNKSPRRIDKSIIITGYIKLVISMEFEIEQEKIVLSKKEDFNIKSLYNIYESKTYPNKISITSFKRASLNFGIEFSNKDLYLIFKKYDLEQKGYLVYEDFFNIFVPFEKDCREDVLKKENNNQSISTETSLIIQQILTKNIEFENQLDKMKKGMNVQNENIRDYFNLIDRDKKGFLVYDDLHFFMNSYLEDNLSNQIGINLFFLKLDKKKQNKVLFENFFYEIKS